MKNNEGNTLVVIGLGLIGGSLALDLKERLGYHIIGVDQQVSHVNRALELGIINEAGTIADVEHASVVIIAIPVNLIPEMSVQVLDLIKENTLVFDVGSVKGSICEAISSHPNRGHFVAAHPLAGTEFSGPDAAIRNLFDEKVNIICETDKTHWKILDVAFSLFKKLNMRIKMMDPKEHDRHIAYVSHLSHVSSFMLGKTVLEIEQNEQHIFDMASTGFASTVRLAKSSANTWTPIFLENKENILRALDEYIKNLVEFRTMVQENKEESLNTTMNSINYIKTILNGIKENS